MQMSSDAIPTPLKCDWFGSPYCLMSCCEARRGGDGGSSDGVGVGIREWVCLWQVLVGQQGRYNNTTQRLYSKREMLDA